MCKLKLTACDMRYLFFNPLKNRVKTDLSHNNTTSVCMFYVCPALMFAVSCLSKWSWSPQSTKPTASSDKHIIAAFCPMITHSPIYTPRVLLNACQSGLPDEMFVQSTVIEHSIVQSKPIRI